MRYKGRPVAVSGRTINGSKRKRRFSMAQAKAKKDSKKKSTTKTRFYVVDTAQRIRRRVSDKLEDYNTPPGWRSSLRCTRRITIGRSHPLNGAPLRKAPGLRASTGR